MRQKATKGTESDKEWNVHHPLRLMLLLLRLLLLLLMLLLMLLLLLLLGDLLLYEHPL